ncbi:Pinoresinol reductase 1 [Colletotrichum orbiculare MAFF 240422]|uniref:Pinoresinol reductase 1 n=1 Tax=Colletotrichum orbiculare (strain 104-T / ATCC 96160 / CBS 514.97 / LARS 414 / MAFF 240422) TaxID=1213857 RepID=N4VGW3_COLOR|nr:Pinoresinol reductase 1 [Colletotrichum orbiculare MAFF 240422]
MSAIKKVALIGASGNLGPKVLSGLVEGGFQVTVLSRQESSATFPSEVTVKKVDFSSLDSLKDALQGQDAVVSAAASAAIGAQKLVIDAAVATQVKRFIPSEFGIHTREAQGTKIGKILTGKIQITDYLIEISKKHDWFSWTGIAVGPFFDWNFSGGLLGIDVKNKTAKIFDSGNERFSASTLGFVGKAVAGVLKNPEATANKYIEVASFTTTQREVLKLVEEQTGASYTVTKVQTSELEKIADDKLAKGDWSAFIELLQQHEFGDGKGNAVKENAAVTLLGLKEEDLKTEIKKVVSA